jgi:hypothetical protein
MQCSQRDAGSGRRARAVGMLEQCVDGDSLASRGDGQQVCELRDFELMFGGQGVKTFLRRE